MMQIKTQTSVSFHYTVQEIIKQSERNKCFIGEVGILESMKTM